MSSPLKPSLRLLAVLSIVAAMPLSGSAQLVYSNGVPDNINGYPITSPDAQANDFPLLFPTQLGSFDWYLVREGHVATGNPGPATITSNFSWDIYSDAGGTVGTGVGGGDVFSATGTKTAFFCCGTNLLYETYLFAGIGMGGLSLGAGQYWLGLSNYVDTDPSATYIGYLATSAQTGNQQWFFASEWTSADVEGAFSIYGLESQVVPEPASITLFGAGIVGLYGFIHRRRRASGKNLMG